MQFITGLFFIYFTLFILIVKIHLYIYICLARNQVELCTFSDQSFLNLMTGNIFEHIALV